MDANTVRFAGIQFFVGFGLAFLMLFMNIVFIFYYDSTLEAYGLMSAVLIIPSIILLVVAPLLTRIFKNFRIVLVTRILGGVFRLSHHPDCKSAHRRKRLHPVPRRAGLERHSLAFLRLFRRDQAFTDSHLRLAGHRPIRSASSLLPFSAGFLISRNSSILPWGSFPAYLFSLPDFSCSSSSGKKYFPNASEETAPGQPDQ